MSTYPDRCVLKMERRTIIGESAEIALKEAEHILANLEGIEFVYFTEKDVVRHKLVQMIIKAYESHTKKSDI